MSSKLAGKRNRSSSDNGFHQEEPATKRHCSKGNDTDEIQRRRDKLSAWNQNMKVEDVQPDNKATQGADEVDPLDAFMVGIETSVQQLCKESIMKINAESQKKVEIPEARVEESTDQSAALLIKTGKKVLEQVDHAKEDYIAFRKDLYIEVPDVTDMTDEQVAEYRAQLDDIKIRGKQCPKPIKNFTQCGLNSKILSVLKKSHIEKPTPIQAQALPAIMSGRDVIGIAKTGSGKTLAYLLPLIRHILDQPPRTSSDGPIALIMAPVHELVIQINDELKKFKAATGIKSIAVYGGTGVASQIGDLKRGADVVVCTPGRMIDLLCKNKGRITNLKRVTCVVLDEADRMFDMGFESQIRKIIGNVRPDRQVVMFSATFPRVIETAARSLLRNPLELTVQGKTIVADTIDQFVEVLTEEEKLSRVMELISSWYDKGSVLIFVDTQDAADSLFRDVIKSGYACVTLHGGKEQIDRETTISDFRRGHVKIMIATSVAARGLDVPSIRLVLNYDVPNHLQDYIHRVGRTGRAGNSGTAITFITPDEEQCSPDLVKALKNAKVALPVKLEELHNQFQAKLRQGTAKHHAGGYVNVGGLEKLAKKEDRKRAERKLQMKMLTGEDYVDSDDEKESGSNEQNSQEHEKMDLDGNSTQTVETSASNDNNNNNSNQVVTIEQWKQRLNAKLQSTNNTASAAHCSEEYAINEYAQNVLYRVTNRDALRQIEDLTGCSVTKKGLYVAPGRKPPVGERTLYLLIEGRNGLEVQTAKAEIKKRLEEAVCNVHPDRTVERRFSVV